LSINSKAYQTLDAPSIKEDYNQRENLLAGADWKLEEIADMSD
jgi:hypothetical protein